MTSNLANPRNTQLKTQLKTPVVVLVVLLVAAAVVAVVGLGTDGAPAIVVGDQRLSKQSFNSELRDWAEFPPAQARSTSGAVTGDASATIATQTVYRLLADSYLERTGERVTPVDRSVARSTVAGNADFASASPSFQRRFLELQSTFAALTRLVGADDQGTAEVRLLRREARRVGVSVAAPYGRFVPASIRVVPYPTPFTPADG